MTKWFSDILRFLEARRGLGWTELADMILSTHYHNQVQIELRFEGLARKLRRQGRPLDGQLDTVLCSPPPWSKKAIAVLALFEEGRERRHAEMAERASQTFANDGVKVCGVIARGIDGSEYPYTTFGLFWSD
jgi:hypothetical protein